jgi:ribosomal protein S12 methylthiotransferase accessory factor
MVPTRTARRRPPRLARGRGAASPRTALPDGFTEEAIASRLLDPGSLASRAAGGALAAGLEGRGFGVHLLDASPGAADDALTLPCAAAVIVDHALGPVPVSAGYACRLDRDEALLDALLEAAQSRATEIHGAREDVLVGDRHAAASLAALLAAARSRREAARMPSVRVARGGSTRASLAAAAAGVRAVLERLRRAGVSRAVAIELEGPPGVHVVKVLVPGLALSELL